MQQRTVVRKLLSDQELAQEAKNNNYKRSEQVQDALNRIFIWSIYIGSLLLLALVIVVFVHLIQIGDYERINEYTINVALFFVGYLVAYLRKHGLKSDR